MTTRLEGPLKREIDVDGAAYTLTISPKGFRLVPKGKRNGYEIAWTALLNGDAGSYTRARESPRATRASR
ncbi:MAG TPA: hypothetical protein VFC24_01095 [Casimicrobiaceae bacterium]|nr:hypothetical protein [Casimicrobiaceae bacterium]